MKCTCFDRVVQHSCALLVTLPIVKFAQFCGTLRGCFSVGELWACLLRALERRGDVDKVSIVAAEALGLPFYSIQDYILVRPRRRITAAQRSVENTPAATYLHVVRFFGCAI